MYVHMCEVVLNYQNEKKKKNLEENFWKKQRTGNKKKMNERY